MMIRETYVAGAVTFSLLTTPLLAGGVEDVTRARQLQREAGKALGEEDYTLARTQLTEAAQLRPEHPALRYTLASLEALTGDKVAAMASLQRLVELGASYDPTREAEFVAWVGEPEFDGVVAALKANGESRTVSQLEMNVAGITTGEGVAFDPHSGDYFVGTVRRGELWRVGSGGETSLLYAPEGSAGSILGLGVDPVGQVLWASRSVLPESEGSSETTRAKATLLRFDLQAPASPPQVFTPPGEGPITLGDLAVSPRGDVVVSDPVSGLIYEVPAGAQNLNVWVGAGQLLSPQGLVWWGNQVLVADYALGLMSISRKDGQVSPVKNQSGSCLLGIDGLLLVGRDLVAIQNGTTPMRVVYLRRSWRGSIREVEVLEVAHPQWVEPTVGSRVGDDIVYVGTASWGSFKDGQWPADEELAPLKLFRIKAEDLP